MLKFLDSGFGGGTGLSWKCLEALRAYLEGLAGERSYFCALDMPLTEEQSSLRWGKGGMHLGW